MWGTDRGDIVWGYEEEVGQLLAEFGRALIGRLDPAVQDRVAYKNAEFLANKFGGSQKLPKATQKVRHASGTADLFHSRRLTL